MLGTSKYSARARMCGCIREDQGEDGIGPLANIRYNPSTFSARKLKLEKGRDVPLDRVKP